MALPFLFQLGKDYGSDKRAFERVLGIHDTISKSPHPLYHPLSYASHPHYPVTVTLLRTHDTVTRWCVTGSVTWLRGGYVRVSAVEGHGKSPL